MPKRRGSGGDEQLDLLAPADDRCRVIADLAARVVRDWGPNYSVSQIAAEVLRATVGIGDYALPTPRPRASQVAPEPVKTRKGKRRR